MSDESTQRALDAIDALAYQQAMHDQGTIDRAREAVRCLVAHAEEAERARAEAEERLQLADRLAERALTVVEKEGNVAREELSAAVDVLNAAIEAFDAARGAPPVALVDAIAAIETIDDETIALNLPGSASLDGYERAKAGAADVRAFFVSAIRAAASKFPPSAQEGAQPGAAVVLSEEEALAVLERVMAEIGDEAYEDYSPVQMVIQGSRATAARCVEAVRAVPRDAIAEAAYDAAQKWAFFVRNFDPRLAAEMAEAVRARLLQALTGEGGSNG